MLIRRVLRLECPWTKSAKYKTDRREMNITINVPVDYIYMERDVMILMGENPFRGPLEGVGPENRDFFGP
jgi:hypothetical protein